MARTRDNAAPQGAATPADDPPPFPVDALFVILPALGLLALRLIAP